MVRVINGSEVIWRGSWGTDEPQVAVITRMEETAEKNEKYGRERPSMRWNEETQDWYKPFVASLENGRWAYSTQLTPMEGQNGTKEEEETYTE